MTVVPDTGALCTCGGNPTCHRCHGRGWYERQPVDSRLTREQLYMGIARLLANRSTCERGHVGAVIVKDGRIVSTGYNGAPPGLPHCLDLECDVGDCTCNLTGTEIREDGHEYGCPVELGCQRAVHAEANAVAFAARHGVSVDKATMYCTYSPCLACAQVILSAGITGYYYEKEYRVKTGLDLLSNEILVRQV